jgi:glycosyltransferase involved in cell wall biosynthesis
VNKWGGAERVIIALRKIFPDSVLFTSVHKEDRASWAKKIPVRTSFLQKLPFASSYHEAFAAFMPIAFESFNFDDFDLVISVTSESAKGILTKPGTRHISIILTPTRYLWSGYNDYFSNPIFRIVSLPLVWYLRFWDKIASRRPDKLIAISETVRNRIKKYYDLDSEIVYPPLMIHVARGPAAPHPHPTYSLHSVRSVRSTGVPRSASPLRSYFLVVSRLVPYKRVDLAIEAANKACAPLKIIGVGSELGKLKKLAGPTVEFLGYVSDSDLKYYYSNCKALIFPGVEDFGLTMVEAQAFGKPVIAYRGGGAREIIIEGKTGVFFEKQTAASLADKLKNFRPSRYNSVYCRKNARRFSFGQFRNKIINLVQRDIETKFERI